MGGAVLLSAMLLRPIDAAMEQQCVDHSKDPAGCQPSTFDTPLAQMPSIRVNRQEEIDPAIAQAEKWMAEHKVPVVIEIMLERVTNIAMGAEIDKVVEFEELAGSIADAPTAIAALLD